MAPRVHSLDHLVLTVRDLAATRRFYADMLGMAEERFTGADGHPRLALRFGRQKLNLHEAGREIAPHARAPQPGSADICLLTDDPIDDWLAHLAEREIAVELGPVPRTGAEGPLTSIYLRDPDGNLVEIARRG